MQRSRCSPQLAGRGSSAAWTGQKSSVPPLASGGPCMEYVWAIARMYHCMQRTIQSFEQLTIGINRMICTPPRVPPPSCANPKLLDARKPAPREIHPHPRSDALGSGQMDTFLSSLLARSHLISSLAAKFPPRSQPTEPTARRKPAKARAKLIAIAIAARTPLRAGHRLVHPSCFFLFPLRYGHVHACRFILLTGPFLPASLCLTRSLGRQLLPSPAPASSAQPIQISEPVLSATRRIASHPRRPQIMSIFSRYNLRPNRGFLGSDSSALPSQDAQDRQQLRYELDLNSWNLRIWGVAASGFLTDSYNLFSTNVILASIAFVYWPEGPDWYGLLINLFTLFGSVIGQLLFGYLADRYGRTRLYGIELVLVIVSTIGVATSSHGYEDLSFLGLFVWWRFVMGIGIGAEYPLSAVITSEWASTQSRGTMIASVFMMQPIGQALAQIVGLFVLLGFEKSHNLREMRCGLDTLHEEECRKALDGIWRIVIGSGAVPALLAIIFRFFLFDCGIYSLEVRNKSAVALMNTQRIYGAPHGGPPEGFGHSQQTSNGYPNNGNHMTTSYQMNPPNGAHTVNSYQMNPLNAMQLSNSPQPMPVQFSKEDLHNYFIRDGNWAYLLGTAATWFFLDVSFYVSLASISGSACFVIFANRIPRRLWLTGSFLVLTLFFVVTGCVYYGVHQQQGAPATVVFVAICHFMFNFGANTLTFMIPAEIFPTCYRCTCHGISAAAGKLGSIVAVLVVYGINSSYDSKTRQGLIFLLFGSVAAVGAIFSWAYLPNVQRWVEYDGRKHLESKTLEELGEGRIKARLAGETVTLNEKVDELRRRKRGSHRSEGSVPLPDTG
ncbi:hypothetical protein G7Z17_g7104 [Cylindrodendrum hubeiense]|uniref:Major facilitator superfamily (MFS) profile domain-containing protein n=1 Tax=Cylindrodendrum hubeiense TaxID=595255 RepID=A0A9P5L7N3_9HYPO|nr:hypothetical protein G7Z17_g7104 [Cylindrodendrum hubeiense]